MNRDEQMLREAFDALHASAKTRLEVMNMNQTKEHRNFVGKRMLTAALIAVLALALAVGAMAAAGVFRMNIREADPEERFAGPSAMDANGNSMTYWWEGAKLVFSFDGPDTCSRIRFRPNALPYEANAYFSTKDEEGWYSCISCEGTGSGGRSSQPCRIDVRYAPMFVDGGSLLLLYADDVTEIVQEEWNGFSVTKFQSHKLQPNGHTVDCSYYMLYQPEQGFIVTVSSMEDNLDTLERIAQSLEIEQTGEIVSAADWHEHNEFLDCGVG